MALVDTDPRINLAYGVAGLSIALDSLSAIKYAKVTARRNERGATDGFDIEGGIPLLRQQRRPGGPRAWTSCTISARSSRSCPSTRTPARPLAAHHLERDVRQRRPARRTTDAPKAGFRSGANPMHGRDKSGAIASLASVAKVATATRRAASRTPSRSFRNRWVRRPKTGSKTS